MTTTVIIKARAWGANVTKGDQSLTLGSNEDRTFHLEDGESLTVNSPNEAPTGQTESLNKIADEPAKATEKVQSDKRPFAKPEEA